MTSNVTSAQNLLEDIAYGPDSKVRLRRRLLSECSIDLLLIAFLLVRLENLKGALSTLVSHVPIYKILRVLKLMLVDADLLDLHDPFCQIFKFLR